MHLQTDSSQPEAGTRERAWLATLLWREDGRWLGHMAAWYDRLRRMGRAQQRWLARRAAVTLAGAALLLALSQSPAHGNTIDVVNGEVAIDNNGKCSLMEAIINARQEKNPQRYPDCAPGTVDGPDTVNLPQNGFFQLTEAHNSQFGPTGLPVITSEVTIEGNGSAIARKDSEGDPEFRLLAVDTSGDLTIRNLTLQDGYIEGGGAGILNRGKLTVERSTITGNFSYWGAGGIASSGELTVTGSQISLNVGYNGAGGIASSGKATINSTLIFGNDSQYYGGALTNYGEMIVTNSTISGNLTAEDVAGIANSGTLTLNNSTVSGNECWYSGFGGIFNYIDDVDGTLILNRSLIAGNYSSDFFEETYFHEEIRGGTVIANNYNVFGFDGDPGGFVPGPTDIVPDGALATVLGTLASNGGDTRTHALPPGSPAIDFAPSGACFEAPVNGKDQRGLPRSVDGDGAPSERECDAGAFERQPAQTPTPTATATWPATPTVTPSLTVTPSPSPTGGVTATGTPLPTLTGTPRPSRTPTATATVTRDPSETATPTVTVLPTADLTPGPTATATRRPFDYLSWLPVIR